MREIKEAMKSTRLTKTSRMIGEFILDNIEEACFMTSTDIAVRVGVSESSVIRFTRALNFSGFMEFQKSLRKSYSEKVSRISNTIIVPSERLIKSMEDRENTNPISEHFENAINDINSVIKNNTEKSFNDAASIILNSKRKFIISSRANSGVGNYFFLLLRHMVDDVYGTNSESLNVIDLLCDINENDCIIIFSFPRYSELDKAALEMASEKGAEIIAFTDKASSFPAHYANVLITVDVDTSVFFNSYVGVQFAMETLCVAISHRIGCSNEEKLNTIDKYLGRFGIF